MDNTLNSLENNFPGVRLWVGGNYPYDFKGMVVCAGENKKVKIDKSVGIIHVWCSDCGKLQEEDWNLFKDYPLSVDSITIRKIENF